MTLQVGDKVVVFNAGTDYARAVKIEPVEVGDKVTVVTLSDGTKIPLPRIDLSTSEYVFVIPKWDLPFKIGGDISWELMTLGAAVFTLTAAACHVLTDDQREWTGGELSGCQIRFLTGYLKRTYVEISANTDTEYEISPQDEYPTLPLFGSAIISGDYSITDFGGVSHTVKQMGHLDGIGNSMEIYSKLEYGIYFNLFQTLNLIGAYSFELKYTLLTYGVYSNPLDWCIIWLGGDNIGGISPNDSSWKRYPNFEGSGIETQFTSLYANSNYPESNTITRSGIYGVSGETRFSLDIRKGNYAGSRLILNILSLVFFDVDGNKIDNCIGGIGGAQAGDQYVIYDPSSNKLKMSDSHKTILSSAYWRDVLSTGEEISVGPVEYIWDGQGKVYLSQSESTLSTIMFDDLLKVVGTSKTLDYTDHVSESVTYSGVTVQRELVNITSILRAGKNQITLVVKDSTGTKIGFPTPVYIVRSM